MINAFILTAVLLGEPAPQHRLYLGTHSGDWQGKRLIADVSRDAWIQLRFEVQVVEQDFVPPRWATSRSTWNAFPKVADAPRGIFCTSGFAASILRKELATHLAEIHAYDPPDIWYQDQVNRHVNRWVPRFRYMQLPPPAPAPLFEEGN